MLGEVIQHLGMEMHKPVVHEQKDPVSHGIVLLDTAEEASHFLDWRGTALPADELPSAHIQAACHAPDRVIPGSLLDLKCHALASASPSPVHHGTAIIGHFIFIQEDIALWISSVEVVERADGSHLVVGEQVGGMYMRTSALGADCKSFEQFADPS